MLRGSRGDRRVRLSAVPEKGLRVRRNTRGPNVSFAHSAAFILGARARAAVPSPNWPPRDGGVARAAGAGGGACAVGRSLGARGHVAGVAAVGGAAAAGASGAAPLPSPLPLLTLLLPLSACLSPALLLSLFLLSSGGPRCDPRGGSGDWREGPFRPAPPALCCG